MLETPQTHQEYLGKGTMEILTQSTGAAQKQQLLAKNEYLRSQVLRLERREENARTLGYRLSLVIITPLAETKPRACIDEIVFVSTNTEALEKEKEIFEREAKSARRRKVFITHQVSLCPVPF